MKKSNKELIRINLNRRKGILESLKSLDITTAKEFIGENVYPVIFLVSLAILIIVALIYLYLRNEIQSLEEQVAIARDKKNKILSEIRILKRKIADIEFSQKLVESLEKYNREAVEHLKEAYSFPSTALVQNVSFCADLKFKRGRRNVKSCDINKAIKISLGKSKFQIDLVLLTENVSFKDYTLIKQTYIELGGLPFKRLCLQKRELPQKTAKK